MDKKIEARVEKTIENLKDKINTSEHYKKEQKQKEATLATLLNRYEMVKGKEHSGDILNEILEIKDELSFLKKYNADLDKVISDHTAWFFNIKVCDLISKMGDKLDSMYSQNKGYNRETKTNFERYERVEYDDFGEYNTYSHTMDAGFKITNPDKEIELPTFSFGCVDCPLSSEYIFENENVNLYNAGLINIKDGEFASEEWQNFFWDIYKDNLRSALRAQENINDGQAFEHYQKDNEEMGNWF